MKKLMTFELYKSTYMSAATRLEKDHKKRAEELRKHAAEKGISAFLGNDEFQSIYGYPFILQNHSKLKGDMTYLGKFFITDFKDKVYGAYRDGYHGVDVVMKSDYGEKIIFELCLNPSSNYFRMDVGNANDFKFENRKDALQFRNFIIELAEDDELMDGSLYFNLKTMPINRFYTTNKE